MCTALRLSVFFLPCCVPFMPDWFHWFQLMNKPELMVQIFRNPSPFDMSTGDLVETSTQDNCQAVIEGLITWAERIRLTEDSRN